MERADVVWYAWLHADPPGWFPHYTGYADERGSGPGGRRQPELLLAPGTGDDGWPGRAGGALR